MATVKENFLINPPKRLPKSSRRKAKSVWRIPSAKSLGEEGTRHRPVAYSHKGHWFTSPSSKVAMPGHKLNPFRRRRKMRSNPFGEEVMLVGLNPKKRRDDMALFGRHKRYNPFKRHRRNPHKRYRRNPMSSVTSMLPMVAGGAAGAVAVKWVPSLFGFTTGLMYYGAQVAAIVAGGYAADKFISKNVSDGWIVGGGAILITELLSGVLAPLGLAGMDAFPVMGPQLTQANSYAGMGAMPSYHDAYAY